MSPTNLAGLQLPAWPARVKDSSPVLVISLAGIEKYVVIMDKAILGHYRK
jgi:hypothetical protein